VNAAAKKPEVLGTASKMAEALNVNSGSMISLQLDSIADNMR